MKKPLCITNANTVKSRDLRKSLSMVICRLSDRIIPLIPCKEQFFKLPQYTAHRLTCLDLVCDKCGKDFRTEVDKTNVKGHHVVFQRAKRK